MCHLLGADNFVASFMLGKIGNTELYKGFGDIICDEDRTIIDRLPHVPSIINSFGAVRRYIASPKPNGCS